MSHNDKYIWCRIVAFCQGTDQEIEQTRQALFSVCKKWRKEFKLHLWAHATLAYCKALEAKNYRLANSIWDFSGECIDCRSETVVKAVFMYGNVLHANRIIARDDFDPSALNCAIRLASEHGHVDVVRLLLKDPRVDPSALDNYAIRLAGANGHVDVVRLLLKDPRVDPSAKHNYAIYWASERGYVDVVQLLLKDLRVDPSADHNFAIRWASSSGHIEVVKLLSEDPRVDPFVGENFVVRLVRFLVKKCRNFFNQ